MTPFRLCCEYNRIRGFFKAVRDNLDSLRDPFGPEATAGGVDCQPPSPGASEKYFSETPGEGG